jgi:hypothetical protein
MGYEVTCSCGQVQVVSEGMAGSSISCSCGRTVSVPSLGELHSRAAPAAGPPPGPCLRPPDEPPLRPDPFAEIIAPTPIWLRTEPGDLPSRAASVLAALTSEDLWIQETYQLRQVPLRTLAHIEARRNGLELALSLQPDLSTETLILTFASAAQGERWHKEIQPRQQNSTPRRRRATGTCPRA